MLDDTDKLISGLELRSVIKLVATILKNSTIEEWNGLLVAQAANGSSANFSSHDTIINDLRPLLSLYDRCFATLEEDEKGAVTELFGVAGLTYLDLYSSAASLSSTDITTDEGRVALRNFCRDFLSSLVTRFSVERPYYTIGSSSYLFVKQGEKLTADKLSEALFLSPKSGYSLVEGEGAYGPIVCDSSKLGITKISYSINFLHEGNIVKEDFAGVAMIIPNTLKQTSWCKGMTISDRSGVSSDLFAYDGAFAIEKDSQLLDKLEFSLSLNCFNDDDNKFITKGNDSIIFSKDELHGLDTSSVGKHYLYISLSEEGATGDELYCFFVPYYVFDKGSATIETYSLGKFAVLQEYALPSPSLEGNEIFECYRKGIHVKINGVSVKIDNQSGFFPYNDEALGKINLSSTGEKTLSFEENGSKIIASYIVYDSSYADLRSFIVNGETEYKVGAESPIITCLTCFYAVEGAGEGNLYNEYSLRSTYELLDPLSVNGVSVSDFYTDKAGTYRYKVKYQGVEATFNYTVVA